VPAITSIGAVDITERSIGR